jgi:hypothetical protein
MDRSPPSSQRRVVETRHVVVNERRAVKELNRGRRRVGQLGLVIARCAGDREAEKRANPRTSGKYSVAECTC